MNTALTQDSSRAGATDDGTAGLRDDERLASLCKAGADALRLRILRVLRHDAMGVSELCQVLDVRQPALSHHLKLMSAAGLLSSQRDGNHIFYRRQDTNGSGPDAVLRQALFSAVDRLGLDGDTRARQASLQRQREANSRNFFLDNAERFRSQQDLIAAPDRYRGAVETAIATLGTGRTVLEVGPGDGWLLPFLAQRFSRVVALDNSALMLEQAQQTAAGCGGVEFLLGDTGDARLEGLAADLVVLNMVLHHTPEPAATLREAAAVLAPEGVLLVTELCEHRQGWARENCGDLWLGFAPEALEAWAHEAGLLELTGSYLGQRNGFTVQLRLFGTGA